MSQKRIDELAAKILQARNHYYNGTSEVSDQVYDAWIDELHSLDPKNLAVIGIGAQPVSDWEKYTHLTEMGSLNKSQTFEEFTSWYNKYLKSGDEMLLTLKLDGLSVSLIYQQGKLVKASTRGSGIVGELITPNVAKMQGVPLRLKDKIDVTIRGEILLSKKNHAQHFATYSNTRNAASGISRRYDGEGSDKLSVLVYQAVSDELDFKTQKDMMETLKNWGFNVPTFYVVKTPAEILKLRNEYQSSLRDQYDYDLDGLVVHHNELSEQDKWGSLNGRPYASIAYKFDSVAIEAHVSDIKIQVGNTGRITPVAIFDPKVNLMGAEVGRATLHNFPNIARLGLDIGAKVLVSRKNDVIPFVEEVVTSTGTVFPTPTNCPICNSKLIESGEYIQCPNVNCKGQVIGRLQNWVNELNLLEWGEAILEKLVLSGKVTTVADLYTLSIGDIASLDRLGEKTAKKCLDILHNNKHITLDVFLGGLSIPMIGGSTIRAIMAEGCDTLEKFGQLKAENFEQVSGVGPSKARSLADGLKYNRDLILKLLDNGVTIKNKVHGKLSGYKIAVTGSTKTKRADLEKIITDNGGENKSSVGKTCTHLIIADVNSASSKAVSARKLGIKLVSEDDLLNLVK